MGIGILRKMIFVSVVLAVVFAVWFAVTLVNTLREFTPLQKIRHEVEHYDNWAVFKTDSSLSDNHDDYVEIDTDLHIDRRVAPYAIKMLEEAQENGIHLELLSTYRGLSLDFSPESDSEWLRHNSWRYGFTLRYPQGKEGITGYNYNPWHYRYVGVFPAEQMYYSDLSLEEYLFIIRKN